MLLHIPLLALLRAAEEVDDLVVGDAEVWRRAVPGSDPAADPRGGDMPYVSPEVG